MGLIPAHAGKTANVSILPSHAPTHPRSRGENTWYQNLVPGFPGSSPLTRGKPRGLVGHCEALGLIPAHAGKTVRQHRCSRFRTAHPRSRGENDVHGAVGEGVDGSSPLTRGKLGRLPPLCVVRRLIPAHAGKTVAIAA